MLFVAHGLFVISKRIAFMFRFLTSTGHRYTVDALVRPVAEPDIPRCEVTTYDAVLRSSHTVRAVHVFTDIERLSDSQLIAAAGLYRALREVGVPCLNDPAKVMGRYQLLCNLFEAGINPFAVYRGDVRPKPAQFPVFVRSESDHDGPMSTLIKDQDELDDYLKRLIDAGRPLRGLLVVEYAAEAEPGGIWRKTGTFRIGKNNSIHHHILSDNWVIKSTVKHITNDARQLEEQAAIIANEVPEAVRRAFDIAGVEWGRADHGKFRGREIIFEINTNPVAQTPDPYGNAIRIESKRIAFARMCALLRQIDWGDGTVIRYRLGKPIWQMLAESHRIRRLVTQSASLIRGATAAAQIIAPHRRAPAHIDGKAAQSNARVNIMAESDR
jgi:hypothetical protein